MQHPSNNGKAGKQRSPWLSRIGSRAEARAMTKETAFALLFLALLQIGFSFMYGFTLLIHAAILVTGSVALLHWRSRTAAVALLLYALVGAGLTLAIKSGIPVEGNKNLSLALIVIWTSIKAVEASFKLHGRFALKDNPGGIDPASA